MLHIHPCQGPLFIIYGHMYIYFKCMYGFVCVLSYLVIFGYLKVKDNEICFSISILKN